MWLRRLAFLFRRRRFEHDLADELQQHVEARERALIDEGLSLRDARDRARREVGSALQLREQAQDVWRIRWLDELGQNVRYAARMLWRRPADSLGTIAVLALGIAASTSMFSFVYGVLLRPLAYTHAERLILVASGPSGGTWSSPAYLALAQGQRSLEGLAAFSGGSANLVIDGAASHAWSVDVTSNFFDVLGVGAARGRTFLRDAPDRIDTDVLISDRLWRDRFGSSADAIGRAIRVNGVSRTIVGVLPPGFVFRTSTFAHPAGADVWVPLRPDPDRHGSWFLQLIGRLRPGVTAVQADSDLLAVAKAVVWSYPHGSGVDPIVTKLTDDVATEVRLVLAVLAAAVALLLVVACTNAAALFLVRAVGRDRELAVRLAIGASRARIVRQLVTESVLLAAVAGAAGVAAAIWLTQLLVASAPAARIPRLERVMVDAPVLAFAVLLTLGVGVLFGLVPAWLSARASRPGQLASGAPGRMTSSRATERSRNALLSLQVGATSVLLVGAVLLGRSLVKLTGNDDGFSTRDVVTATILLPESAPDASAPALWRGLIDDLRRRPGFEGVSAINQMPLNSFFFIRGDLTIEGQAAEAWAAKPKVAPGYFRALDIPIVRGRDFTDADTAGAPPVAIVSELLVRTAFGGRDPIGARLSLSSGKPPWFTVVGVVGDIRQDGPADTPVQAVYVPFAQSEGAFFVRTLSLVVPTALDEDAVGLGVRDALRRLDPTLPVVDVSRLADLRGRALAEPRFRTFLIAVFALVALSLAAAGLFALVSQIVAQRWRELGVRLALGARADQIARLVVGRVAWPVAAGLAAGLALALWFAAALAPFLFQIEPRDVASIAIAAGLLLASALAASALPAWRASRIDPTRALRAD